MGILTTFVKHLDLKLERILSEQSKIKTVCDFMPKKLWKKTHKYSLV